MGEHFLVGGEFLVSMIPKPSRQCGAEHYGEERHKTGDQKAERVVAEALKRRGWKEPELTLQPKGHKVKIAIAKRLRKETTMTHKWIAQRLQMGSWTYVFNLLASEKALKKR